MDRDALAQDELGNNLLHWAADRGHADVVQLLLQDHPERALTKDKWGDTPLHLAACNGHTDVVQRLLNAKPDAAVATNKNGDTPLHWAIARGHADVVQLLLDTYPDFALIKNAYGATPLCLAEKNGFIGISQMIKQACPKVTESTNWTDTTPLHHAAETGDVQTVKTTLQTYPWTALIEDKEGNTPLHRATKNGHTDVVQLLLNANPETAVATDKDGCTPLHWAAERGLIAIVQLLLKDHPERAMIKDRWGNTPLHAAAANGHPQIAHMLLKAKLEMAQEKDKWGYTPLHRTAHPRDCSKHHAQIAAMLLQLYPNTALEKDQWGCTPLHRAAKNGYADIARMLIRMHPQTASFKSDDSTTPLYLAAASWRGLSTVKTILQETPTKHLDIPITTALRRRYIANLINRYQRVQNDLRNPATKLAALHIAIDEGWIHLIHQSLSELTTEQQSIFLALTEAEDYPHHDVRDLLRIHFDCKADAQTWRRHLQASACSSREALFKDALSIASNKQVTLDATTIKQTLDQAVIMHYDQGIAAMIARGGKTSMDSTMKRILHLSKAYPKTINALKSRAYPVHTKAKMEYTSEKRQKNIISRMLHSGLTNSHRVALFLSPSDVSSLAQTFRQAQAFNPFTKSGMLRAVTQHNDEKQPDATRKAGSPKRGGGSKE